MKRAGLPVTLLSGVGAAARRRADPLRGDRRLAFVGGRANGRKAATSLADTGKRHFLEQEGLNAWGIWDFTQWDELAAHLKKGFEYAKQRCTAYPRYVVQRELFPDVPRDVPAGGARACGSATRSPSRAPTTTLPELDFGPVIHAAKAAELRAQYDEAVAGGGIPLYRGVARRDGRFLDGQDTSAYVAPACCSSRRRRGRCATPSRSARWTRSSWSTPRPSCSPR